MRLMQFVLAYAFAVASAILASLYGVLSATGYYAPAKAAVLGLVALGGCHGPAWVADFVARRRWGASALAVVGTIACLLVTLWGGLGTIAGGGAEMRAEREKAVKDEARDRAALSRVQTERDHLPASRPAATVSADLTTARASPLYKTSDECAPEKIVGPKTREHCKAYRQLEGELASAHEAARLDAEIAVVSRRLAMAAPTAEPDPQAAATARLTGWSVEVSAALYALAASLALEIAGMVAMMQAWAEPRVKATPPLLAVTTPSLPPATLAPPRAARRTSPPPRGPTAAQPTNVTPLRRSGGVYGSVRKFALACLQPAEGERLEMKAVFARYQSWCREGGLPAAEVDTFAREMSVIAEMTGLDIQEDGAKLYCVGARLSA